MTITLAPGTVVEIRPQGFVKGVMVVKGPKGDPGTDGADGGPGPANSLSIGTVTTSEPGGPADASITGTAPSQTLNLTIPQGEQGPQGLKGDKGDPGAGSVDSVNGDPGPDIVLDAADVGARPSAWVPDWTDVTGKPSTYTPSAHTHAQSDVTGLSTALAAKADLVSGLVPTSQIPAQALTNVVQVANQAAMLALTTSQVQPGDVATRSDGAGTFMLSGTDPSVLSNWTLLNAPTDKVVSVNGQIGTVVLGKTDIGLGNVDNTSDANKPVSTAQQTALDLKADKASPTFTGTVTAPTPATSDNSTTVATTAFVKAQSSGSSAPLARTTYNFTAGSTTTLTAASTTATSDADASNLAVTFTVPTSGKVRVSLEATIAATSSSGWVYWSLRNGTTDVVGSERFVALPVSTTGRFRLRVEIPLSGLTSGASLTYKWALRGSGVNLGIGNVGEFSNANNNYGPAIMTVFAE